MRKLDRPEAPACLNQYRHGRNKWSDVSTEHKDEIWQQLEKMQGTFCAYCQRSIRQNHAHAHIEHFFRRSSSPRETFVWDNLFGSCGDNNTCGNYKDHCAKAIDPAHICKPDIMDPAVFMQFLSNGTVQPRPDLEANQAAIAHNTISAFNLRHSSLTNRRRAAIAREEYGATELFTYLELMPDEPELLQELEDNIRRIAKLEFSAALAAVWLSPG